METGLIRNRKLLPRWREVKFTSSSELQSASSENPHTHPTDELLKFCYLKWQKSNALEDAFDVICYAQMSKDRTLAYGSAEQIIKSPTTLPEIKNLAKSIRFGKEEFRISNDVDCLETGELLRTITYEKIRSLKFRLGKEPGNSLLWLDLARLQANLGHNQSAELALRRALGAAPDNRLVLRAAARFLTHIGKPDEAHDRLKKSNALKIDPWVQAAEIAVASLAGKVPKSIKAGQANINDKMFSPMHISELAASIGTEEMKHGKTKVAKKLFQAGLVKPTDNTVAQALWIKDQLNIDIEKNTLSTERAFEARATAALNANEYKQAAENCMLWCYDEPFSSVPAIQGTFIASSLMDNQDYALEIFKFGKNANSHDPSLINNGVVAYAKLGDLEEAKNNFKEIQHLTFGEQPNATIIATGGLIEFRSGNTEQGRKEYDRSVQEAAKRKQPDIEFRALMHWLIEEVNASTISNEEKSKALDTFDSTIKNHKNKIPLLTQKLWDLEKQKLINKEGKEGSGSAPPQLFSQLTSI